MLGAAAGASDEERDAEPEEAAGGPCGGKARRAEPRAEHEHGPRPEATSQRARRDLQGRHGAGMDGAQERQTRVAERELGLPHGQEHVDEIRVAVVQGVVRARHRQGAGRIRRGEVAVQRGEMACRGHGAPVLLSGQDEPRRVGLTNHLC